MLNRNSNVVVKDRAVKKKEVPLELEEVPLIEDSKILEPLGVVLNQRDRANKRGQVQGLTTEAL